MNLVGNFRLQRSNQLLLVSQLGTQIKRFCLCLYMRVVNHGCLRLDNVLLCFNQLMLKLSNLTLQIFDFSIRNSQIFFSGHLCADILMRHGSLYRHVNATNRSQLFI